MHDALIEIEHSRHRPPSLLFLPVPSIAVVSTRSEVSASDIMTFVKDVNGDHDGIVGSKPMVKKPSDRAWWKSSTVYQGEPSSVPMLGHADLCSVPGKLCGRWWRQACSPMWSWWLTTQASFADHAANGHGTLLGIKSKVGYLKSLGVDVVWLSPIYESPQADMVSDPLSSWAMLVAHTARAMTYPTMRNLTRDTAPLRTGTV